MDKELLRIVIIATGLLIIMIMLAWSYLNNKKSKEYLDSEDDNFDGSFNNHQFIDDYQDMSSELISTSYNYYFDENTSSDEDDDYIEPIPRVTAPAIIQFSLLSNDEEGFNGIDLANAFAIVGLEYGSLKIYERLDANRLVDYGVTSMVEPGTFPANDLETFYTPGLVFFMQPSALEDAQTIFDDFIDTINLLAIELDGYALDHHKQPFSDETLQALRNSL